jgi:DNA-binding GntR family transcriptional regulator
MLQTKRQTVTAEIADTLREQILSGSLSPGTRLRQDHLAREFSVSNIPVREALGKLTAEGLVTVYPHKGAIVRIFSDEEFEERRRLRVLLESELLERAIPNISRERLKLLRKLTQEMDSPTNLQQWQRLNWEFHWGIYECANSPQTLAFAQQNHSIVDRQLQPNFRAVPRASNAEHKELLKLIERRDTDAAVALLKRHITYLPR